MPVFKATATISFTFTQGGALGKARIKAEEIIESLIRETDEYKLAIAMEVEKLDREPSVIKLREYPVDKILALVPDDVEGHVRRTFIVNKKRYEVKITSDRYRLFKKNRKCVACGLEGTRMFLETHTSPDNQEGQGHFNLYGEEDGKLVLMTKDHIKAKAYGGEDALDNYQTMCQTCNTLKSSYPVGYDVVAKMREVYKQKEDLSKNELKKTLNTIRIAAYECLNGQ